MLSLAIFLMKNFLQFNPSFNRNEAWKVVKSIVILFTLGKFWFFLIHYLVNQFKRRITAHTAQMTVALKYRYTC